jgi:hypothetical protein
MDPKTPLSPAARKSRDEAWKQTDRGRTVAAERNLPPRPLTPEENAVLHWVLEHGSKEAQCFLPQLEGIRALRWCDCGCPSIQLVIEPGTPDVDAIVGNIVCDVFGTTLENEKVGILLFQKNSRLELMELYSLDAGIYGDTPEYGLPTIESLEHAEWAPAPGFRNVRQPIKFPKSRA